MKKAILIFSTLTVLFFGLNSCKNKAEQAPAATETTTAVEPVAPATPATPAAASEVVNSIQVPTFTNPDVTKFCDDYKKLMEEYAAIKGTGDKTKAAELSKKFMTWAEGSATLGSKISKDEMQKFNDFMKEAESKFNEMNTAAAK